METKKLEKGNTPPTITKQKFAVTFPRLGSANTDNDANLDTKSIKALRNQRKQ